MSNTLKRTWYLVVLLMCFGCSVEETPEPSPVAKHAEAVLVQDRVDPARLERLLGAPMLTPESSLSECRRPSVLPRNVPQAREQAACRKIKAVQNELNTMITMDGELFCNGEPMPVDTRATLPEQLEHLTEDSEDALRRQRLFGRYWRTHLASCRDRHADCDTNSDLLRVEIGGGNNFENTVKTGLQRAAAILIASTMPIDRADGVDDWWWELPQPYRTSCRNRGDYAQCLQDRAELMRSDVNAWIQNLGLWVWGNSGTRDDLNGRGDNPLSSYDFVLINVIHFMYAFKDRPDLLEDASIEQLITKNWDAPVVPAMQTLKGLALEVQAEWNLNGSNVPYAGQEHRRELWFIARQGAIRWEATETENHVLMSLTHAYLMNQWIARRYRGYGIADSGSADFDDWFRTDGSSGRIWLRDALARPMHADFFETNAQPYQEHTLRALQVMASFAEDPVMRTEAEAALHFLFTKFAFQSLDGRRSAPMRRNCEHAGNLNLYHDDGTAQVVGLLSGAYKWNDSPYGYREAALRPQACENDPLGEECYWHFYTWKNDQCADDEESAPDLLSAGPNLAHTADALTDDLPQARPPAFWTVLSNYELPRALHHFLLRPHGRADRDEADTMRHGYFARMMPRFDYGHHRESAYRFIAGDGSLDEDTVFPHYFFPDGTVFDNSGNNNERTPELYFVANGTLNAAGGIYNPYYSQLNVNSEDTYVIPTNPDSDSLSWCNNGDLRLENYDNLSRPSIVLPRVPFTDLEYPSGSLRVYRPFAIGDGVQQEEFGRHVPMMLGDQAQFFKSANAATYKNFTYGYKVFDPDPGILSTQCLLRNREGEPLNVQLPCLPDPASHSMLGGSWAIDVPADWARCQRPEAEIAAAGDPEAAQCAAWIPFRQFDYGVDPWWDGDRAAEFKLYDLREFMGVQGQSPHFLVTARIRKRLTEYWSTRVARSFWEVVPENRVDDLAELEQAIRDGNDESGFDVRTRTENFQYRLVTSGELLTLSESYGALFQNLSVHDEGTVQGIIGVATDGRNNSLGNVFYSFMSNGVMNDLPLIDVKAVDENYDFQLDASDNYRYYACARDGWLYVNNIEDDSYLWVDVRRGGGHTPEWEEGDLPSEWFPQCGGSGGGWVPARPADGVRKNCNDGSRCDLKHLTAEFSCLTNHAAGPSTRLSVTVENEGDHATGPARVAVRFDDFDPVNWEPLPALNPGRRRQLEFVLPNACQEGEDCTFEVLVGVEGQAPETIRRALVTGSCPTVDLRPLCFSNSNAVCEANDDCPRRDESCVGLSCTCMRPDLVVAAPSRTNSDGSSPFCDADKDGVTVIVRNAGNSTSPDADLRSTFSGVTRTTRVGRLAAGRSSTIRIPFGSECPAGRGCTFSLAIDPNDDIVELKESNNSGSGSCVAIAG